MEAQEKSQLLSRLVSIWSDLIWFLAGGIRIEEHLNKQKLKPKKWESKERMKKEKERDRWDHME